LEYGPDSCIFTVVNNLHSNTVTYLTYKSHVLLQAICSLEKKLKQHAANEKASGTDEKQTASVPVDPQIYCLLGHLNLLLENYPKGIAFSVG